LALVIVSFALIFILYSGKRSLPLLYLFTFIMGAIISPILGVAIVVGPELILEAFAITSIVFIALTAYGLTTKRDFSFLGGILFTLLLIVIIISVTSIFIALPINALWLDVFVALLFAGFVLYDMSNIRRRYSNDDYIPAVVSLYIDFINLFVRILSILIRLKQRE
ncbi:MAG: Bax inhibitor-1/YccA family protein, partial [Candidatus Aenigmatarchaeota archaeon]